MINTEIVRTIEIKKLGIACLFGGFTLINAQEKQNISGRIVNEQGIAVPYASIEFKHKDNQQFSDAALTDENGIFRLNLANGNYHIIIDAVGFQSKNIDTSIQGAFNIGDIVLVKNQTSTNEKEIEGVTIVAKSNQPYKVELDKKVYNVDQDLNSKGGSLQDVLGNVPSVNVETDGSVSMRGNSNVKFLINGKPSYILGISDDSSDALKSIPADQIDRIEIITNPSSKFEAEGTAGILNIILKKSKSLGFNGSINGSLGYHPSSRLNTNLSWNYGKWTWFVNGGGGISKIKNETSSNIFYKNTGENLNFINTTKPEFKNYNFSTGFNYDFNDKTSANASFTTNAVLADVYNNQQNISTLTGTTFRNTTGNNKNNSIQIDAGIEHKFNNKRHLLSLSGSYQDTKNNSNNIILDNRNSTQTLFEYENIANFSQKTWIGKLDYELPIGENSKIEAGANYDSKKNNIYNLYANILNNNYITFNDVTGNNQYNEENIAFYAQFKSKIDKFGYQFGVRNENISIDINTNNNATGITQRKKNYSEFFPSVFLSYDITNNSQFSLNYSRRIKRPRSFEIIPVMRIQNDPNRFMGNADLNPSFVNSFELSYNYSRKKWNISPSLYYQTTKDDISFVTTESTYLAPITGQNKEYILSTPYNLGTEDRYGLDLNYSINPTTWLRLFGNVNLFRYKNETTFNNHTISNEGNSMMARLTTAFRIDRTLNLQLQGHFRGGQKNYTTERKESHSLNIAIGKNIWNNTASINFSVQDVFNSRKMRVYNNTETFTRYAEMQMMPRQFLLSFSYRFKNDNAKEPKPTKKRPTEQMQEDDGNVMF